MAWVYTHPNTVRALALGLLAGRRGRAPSTALALVATTVVALLVRKVAFAVVLLGLLLQLVPVHACEARAR